MKFLVILSLTVLLAVCLAKKHNRSKHPPIDFGILKPVNSKRLKSFIGDIQSVSNNYLVDTLKEIHLNGTIALKKGIPDEDIYDMVKHFENAFRKFGYTIGKIFFTGRLLLTRSHLAGMFYNKKNKFVYEKVCKDLSYDILSFSSSEEEDDSSRVSSEVSKAKASRVGKAVAASDRAILCILKNTGRYAEEAGKAMEQLEKELKNTPPPASCSTLNITKKYTPKEILAVFLDDLRCFNSHIIHLSTMIDGAKKNAIVSDFNGVRHAVVKSMVLFVMMIGEAIHTLHPFFTMVYDNVPGPHSGNNTISLFEDITSQNIMNIVPAVY